MSAWYQVSTAWKPDPTWILKTISSGVNVNGVGVQITLYMDPIWQTVTKVLLVGGVSAICLGWNQCYVTPHIIINYNSLLLVWQFARAAFEPIASSAASCHFVRDRCNLLPRQVGVVRGLEAGNDRLMGGWLKPLVSSTGGQRAGTCYDPTQWVNISVNMPWVLIP